MKFGFIGLGRMGRGMARSLVKDGHSLVVYDTSAQAVANMVEAGATKAASVADLVSQVQVLFTSLPGPVQVEEVVLGEKGVLASMKPGLVLFDLSTSSLALARRISEAFKEKGGSMLDAPVSGGPGGAASGDLAIWVGGDKDVYDRHHELLRTIGDKASYVGPIGAGTVAKLAHNMVAFMMMQCMAEVFSVGAKAGVEPLAMWQALRLGSAGKQSALMMLVNQFLPGKYEPAAFALELAHKDAMLATNMAKELGVPMRLANLTLEEMTEAMARGWSEKDARIFLKLQMERAGTEVAVDPAKLQAALKAPQA